MTSEEKSRVHELLASKECEFTELNDKLDRLLVTQISMTVSMAEMAGELKELRLSSEVKDR